MKANKTKDSFENIISTLSNLEKEIHLYALAHVEDLKNMTIRNLATNTYTNTGSIMRYCKKMG